MSVKILNWSMEPKNLVTSSELKSINPVISFLFSRRETGVLQTTHTTVRPCPTSNPTWGGTASIWNHHSHLWRRNFQVKWSRWNTDVQGREQEVTWAIESGLRKGSSASISPALPGWFTKKEAWCFWEEKSRDRRLPEKREAG